MAKHRWTKEEREAYQREALGRAVNPLGSLSNYGPIIMGFAARGIPEQDIRPRENVFTYHAWRALGRQVRRGEHGVRVTTFIPDAKEVVKEDGTKELKAVSRPTTAIVFHISQTEPIAQAQSA